MVNTNIHSAGNVRVAKHHAVTVVAERLCEAMRRRNVGQSALARTVGVTQGAISKILIGKTANSRHLPRIAAELGVSYDWLMGLSDDPGDDGGTAEPPQVVLISMPVVLPSERALVRMFEALLRLNRGLEEVELARELAKLLPTGLQQLQDLLPAQSGVGGVAEGEAAAALSNELRGPRRAQRR